MPNQPTATHTLIRKLREHSALSREDIAVIQALPDPIRNFQPNEDLVRQGDEPKASVVVISGMVARYHTHKSGIRQYLSFHIAGDMPEAQSLFLERMDHGVCAIDRVSAAFIPHKRIMAVFGQRPAVGFAIWRETLIDAAIFREAITNNSSRPMLSRLAHFLCEQYYRAQASALAPHGQCSLPLSQTQIGETLGMSLVTANRTMQELRRTRAADHKDGMLSVNNWSKLQEIGEFDPAYLHLKRQTNI